jgi:antitoxin (DNA-binding transcriptional repressor) of toxin-antitoxin stability system
VEAGQTIVICKQNVPVAEIRPIATLKGQKPVLGSAAGTFTIPPSFFEPLPSDVLNVFEGDPSADPIE